MVISYRELPFFTNDNGDKFSKPHIIFEFYDNGVKSQPVALECSEKELMDLDRVIFYALPLV